VTQRTGDADPRQHVLAVDGLDRAFETDDSVQLQQRDRGVGTLQIDRPVLDSRHDRCRQGFGIDLQPDRQCRRGIDCRANHLVHAQRVGPLGLVAERVEAEDLLAFGDPDLIVSARTCLRSRSTTPHTPAMGPTMPRFATCRVACACRAPVSFQGRS
jgi:hypothetical protein